MFMCVLFIRVCMLGLFIRCAGIGDYEFSSYHDFSLPVISREESSTSEYGITTNTVLFSCGLK